MAAQALPNTKKLEYEITSFFLKKRKLTEFDVERLKRDAKNLKGINDAAYYDLLGQIASLGNDKACVIRNYEDALKRIPANYNILHNYAVGLANRGFISEAVAQANILCDTFPEETEALLLRVNYISSLCRFREALQLNNQLDSAVQSPFYKKIKSAVDVFDNACLSDDEAQNLCKWAYSVLETKNLYFSERDIEVIDNSVIYTIYVDLPVEELFEINWELSGVLVENVENMRSNVLMFDYSSVDILDERQKT